MRTAPPRPCIPWTGLDPRPFGTLVQLGTGGEAGGRVPAGARSVLVDGCAARCARLAARHRGRDGVSVLQHALAPAAGTGTWHTHSWAAADGLQDGAAAWADRYPGLRCTGRNPVALTPVGALLAQLALRRDPATASLLIIELPSGGDALLAALTAEQLLAFDWVLVGGAPDPLAPAPAVPLVAQATGAVAADSLGGWAWRVGRVDHRAWQAGQAQQALAERLAQTEAARTLLQGEREQLAAACRHQQAALDGCRQRAEQAERRLVALQQAQDQLRPALLAAEAEREALRSAEQAAQARVSALDETLAALQARHDQLVRDHAVAQAQGAEAPRLQAELQAAQQRLQALLRAEARLDLLSDVLLRDRLK